MALAALLEEVLLLKGFAKSRDPLKVNCAKAALYLGFGKDELYRYLYRGRRPEDEAKRKIIDRLELDGDFVLETGSRFSGKSLRASLAHMALDRYLKTHELDERQATILRTLADELQEPPLWSSGWAPFPLALDVAARYTLPPQSSGPSSSGPRTYQERARRGRPIAGPRGT